jgi:hypothetical protein
MKMVLPLPGKAQCLNDRPAADAVLALYRPARHTRPGIPAGSPHTAQSSAPAP